MLIETLLMTGSLAVSYKVGKVLARALGRYPSKEIEKKRDSLQSKLDIMIDFYKIEDITMRSLLNELNEELSEVVSEKDYLKVEVKVEKYWDIYKKKVG